MTPTRAKDRDDPPGSTVEDMSDWTARDIPDQTGRCSW